MSPELEKAGLSDYESSVCLAWCAAAVEAAKSLPEPEGENLMRACSAGHFRALEMEKTLAPFVGDIRGFSEFIAKEWGWIVQLDEENRALTADENKPFCVCPLTKDGGVKDPLLCHCSEGFAGRMYSMVLQKPVRTKVLRSVLRGDRTCVYEIRW